MFLKYLIKKVSAVCVTSKNIKNIPKSYICKKNNSENLKKRRKLESFINHMMAVHWLTSIVSRRGAGIRIGEMLRKFTPYCFPLLEMFLRQNNKTNYFITYTLIQGLIQTCKFCSTYFIN